jgi:hypothetical protein
MPLGILVIAVIDRHRLHEKKIDSHNRLAPAVCRWALALKIWITQKAAPKKTLPSAVVGLTTGCLPSAAGN